MKRGSRCRTGERRDEARGRRATPCAVVATIVCLSIVPTAEATFRYGPIQISGNIESQQLFRVEDNVNQWGAFDPVQQRNTFRLQYEHELIQRDPQGNRKFLGMFALPGLKKASFFAYYRFVYDSIYHIAPGGNLRTQDGSVAGTLDRVRFTDGRLRKQFSGRARKAIAMENVLREIFLDLELDFLPVSFRIGRQQIVWGNSVNFRALDSTNSLDMTWHLQQEAGILGRVGFSELRIPVWAFKTVIKLPSVGPFANSYLEAYDIPFEFKPTKVTFGPRPWSMNVRNPFRAGLIVEQIGLAIQPCFDATGNIAPNAEADRDFESALTTGLCNSRAPGSGRVTTPNHGDYDAHDPQDVNAFGVRLGSTFTPLGLGLTINYKYQRHVADATGGTIAKNNANFVQDTGNILGFLQFNGVPLLPGDPQTCDPITGVCTEPDAFLPIPLEFYYPYVSIFGLGMDYFDEFTGAVYNIEVAASKGVPIAGAFNPAVDFNGIRRTWEMELALLVDRPTWIRFLNPRATFMTLFQFNASFLPFQDDSQTDVGTPNTNLIPGQFRDQNTLDQRRQVELLSILAMQTFYWGGSLSPLLAVIWDWSNMPAGEIQFFAQYLPTPNVILEPGVRLFWTNGRVADDRYQATKNAGRSEFQLKMTYQF